MNKFMESLANTGRKYTYAFAAIALVTMVSGCQTTDTTKTGSISGRTVDQGFGKKIDSVKKVHPVKKKVLYRKPVTRMTSVTRTSERAYAAFVRPQRIGKPKALKVSYSLGSSGPLLGRSPWICGPSGFGQRSSCRSRY